MTHPALLAVATATPLHHMSQTQSVEAALACCTTDERQARLLRRLYESTTVERRGSVLLEDDSDGELFPLAEALPRGPTTSARMAAFERHAPHLAARACRAAMQR